MAATVATERKPVLPENFDKMERGVHAFRRLCCVAEDNRMNGSVLVKATVFNGKITKIYTGSEHEQQ